MTLNSSGELTLINKKWEAVFLMYLNIGCLHKIKMCDGVMDTTMQPASRGLKTHFVQSNASANVAGIEEAGGHSITSLQDSGSEV